MTPTRPPRVEKLVDDITTTPEYQAIAAHYGARTARRSGVPLMRHIDEGLWILDQVPIQRKQRAIAHSRHTC